MKSLTLIGLALGAGAACTGGERNVTGDCPADEECSALTPNGMHFTGASLVGIPLLDQPKVTAIGGTQLIELYKQLDNGDIVPLDLPFAASTDNGDALEVVSAGPNAVTIEGVGGGADLLRITEADSDLLYDRYQVDAAAIDHVEVVPATFETYALGDPFAFYQGDLLIGLALYDSDGSRLVDEGMILTVPGPQPTRTDWDVFRFEALGPGTLTADLTAGGMEGPIDFEIVDAVDTVELLDGGFVEPIRPGDHGEVCFRATAGSFDTVLGLPWAFEATGSVTPLISLNANCFTVQPNTPGEFTVTATALGVSGTATFTAVATGARVAPTAAAPRALAAPDRIAGDSRGERARLVAR